MKAGCGGDEPSSATRNSINASVTSSLMRQTQKQNQTGADPKLMLGSDSSLSAAFILKIHQLLLFLYRKTVLRSPDRK